MLSKEIIGEVFELNEAFNEDAQQYYGFTYETNGWYECIKFNHKTLWDSEDYNCWLSERPDWDEDGDIENDYDGDIIGCVKRRFNDSINLLKTCRFDVKSNKSENNDAFEAASAITDDLNGRKGYNLNELDEDIRDEIFQTWVNIIEKYN